MPAKWIFFVLLALLGSPGNGQGPVGRRPDEAWLASLDSGRRVVDRVVLCFDAGSFLEEIGKWDRGRFWPVLLWDAEFAPKLIAAFGPKQILLRRTLSRPVKEAKVLSDRVMISIRSAWSDGQQTRAAARATPPSTADFLADLRAMPRKPLGAVLLALDSPELLGGVALAAGRFHLPLWFETSEKHTARVKAARVDATRARLKKSLHELGLAFEKRFDELDFITVANDLPFGYVPTDPSVHGGGYTVDDALARNQDLSRWGWVGRLIGGPARSVYMTMCALFLQPKRGLLFSRYAQNGKGGFGAFDPGGAPEELAPFFPCDLVRHPEATLAAWRQREWPRGNRYGFVFVNSSGGATGWSTSRGKASHFDVPESVPCVVHYTHSGSAARPFDVDTIAGRWLANGAYVYLGSYSEPYLSAFVPPRAFARRVARGLPLGIAMRHFYQPRAQARIQRKGATQPVTFNVTGPWKLAYFGDPSYRLQKESAPRLAPERLHGPYFTSRSAFLRARPRAAAPRLAHDRAGIGLARLPGEEKHLIDPRLWRRLLGRAPKPARVAALREEMLRNFLCRLRRAGPERYYDEAALHDLKKLPRVLARLMAQSKGPGAFTAARLLDDFAKEYIAGLDRHPSTDQEPHRSNAAWVLELARRLEHSKGERKPFEAWRKQVLKTLQTKH